MSSPLPGNPHVGPAITMCDEANKEAHYEPAFATFHNAQALVAATLALAYEQRTANLIAFEMLRQGARDVRSDQRIGERLGLT